MRLRYVSLLAFLLATPLLAASVDIATPGLNVKAVQPEVAPMPKEKDITFVQLADGTEVRVVPREQLRAKSVKKRFSLAKTDVLKDVKDPPAEFDWSKGGQIKFPMHGNDRYGDCYYVAPIHQVEQWLGMNNVPITFKDADIINRYRKLSGGDNGLSDEDVFPEWRSGIIGPNGPHKVLDIALIDPTDWASVKKAMYYLGGSLTTHALQSQWTNFRQGMLWDNVGRPNPRLGHAVQQSGVAIKNGKETLQTNTWGGQAYLTQAGLANSDAEVIVSVSAEWFDSRGYAPNGVHYNEVAKVWEAGTGHKLPQGLFPDPGPTPAPPVPPTPVPPTPPQPSTGNVVIDLANKTVTLPPGWTVAGGGTVIPLPGATSPAVEFVKNHAAKRQARKDGAGLIVSKSELAAARAKIDAAVSDGDVEQMLKEKGGKIGGPLTDLLEWITSHQAELENLISLILKLVALFAQVDLPHESSVCELVYALAV